MYGGANLLVVTVAVQYWAHNPILKGGKPRFVFLTHGGERFSSPNNLFWGSWWSACLKVACLFGLWCSGRCRGTGISWGGSSDIFLCLRGPAVLYSGV